MRNETGFAITMTWKRAISLIRSTAMQISIEDAQDILDEFVDLTLAGEEVILMLDGCPVAQLVSAAETENEAL